MKENGTVWIITNKKTKEASVILTEQALYDWYIEKADNCTRNRYKVKEVICYK